MSVDARYLLHAAGVEVPDVKVPSPASDVDTFSVRMEFSVLDRDGTKVKGCSQCVDLAVDMVDAECAIVPARHEERIRGVE